MVPFPGRVMSGGRVPLENKINKTVASFFCPSGLLALRLSPAASAILVGFFRPDLEFFKGAGLGPYLKRPLGGWEGIEPSWLFLDTPFEVDFAEWRCFAFLKN